MSLDNDNTPLRLEVLKFGADWCGTCRLIDPVLDRVVNGHAGVEITRVDVGADDRLAKALDVRSLPTLVMRTPDGQILGRMSGPMSGKTIELALQSALAEIRA